MSTISERLKSLIEVKTSPARRHKEMEEATKLPAEIWKAWWHGKQRPNEEMIQAVAQLWPEFAFWLVAGIDDFSHGHRNPLSPNDRDRTAARPYFKKELEALKWKEEHPNAEDDEQERVKWLMYQVELHELHEIRDAQEQTLIKIAMQKWKEEQAENVEKYGVPF